MRSYVACLVIPVAVAMSGTGAAPARAEPSTQPAVAPMQLVQSTVIIAPGAPPPPREEPVPPPLERTETVIWQQGHWSWTGDTWAWIPGGYIRPPEQAAVWDPGHWLERPDGWMWVDGHWR